MRESQLYARFVISSSAEFFFFLLCCKNT